MVQQFPAVVSSVLPFPTIRGTQIMVVCGMIYLFYYTNFHGQDRMFGQIEMPVDRLVASLINLKSMPVHSTPYWLFVYPTYTNPHRPHSMPYTKLVDLQYRLAKLYVVKERLVKLQEKELSVMRILHSYLSCSRIE